MAYGFSTFKDDRAGVKVCYKDNRWQHYPNLREDSCYGHIKKTSTSRKLELSSVVCWLAHYDHTAIRIPLGSKSYKVMSYTKVNGDIYALDLKHFQESKTRPLLVKKLKEDFPEHLSCEKLLSDPDLKKVSQNFKSILLKARKKIFKQSTQWDSFLKLLTNLKKNKIQGPYTLGLTDQA